MTHIVLTISFLMFLSLGEVTETRWINERAEVSLSGLSDLSSYIENRQEKIQIKLTNLARVFREQHKTSTVIDDVVFEESVLRVSYSKRPDLLTLGLALRSYVGYTISSSYDEENRALELQYLITAGFEEKRAQEFLNHVANMPTFENILKNEQWERLYNGPLDFIYYDNSQKNRLTNEQVNAYLLLNLELKRSAEKDFAIQLLDPLTVPERIILLDYLFNQRIRANQEVVHFLLPFSETLITQVWDELQNASLPKWAQERASN